MAAHDIGVDREFRMPARVLDGATGSELERRGVCCELPLWSARAQLEAPELVRAIHRYAASGSHALTANTFQTQHRTLSPRTSPHSPTSGARFPNSGARAIGRSALG